MLVGVGMGWGATQLLSKIAVSTGHHPLGLNAWSTLVGVVAFAVILPATGRRLPLARRHLVFYLVCGLIGTALPHTLSLTAVRHLPVGIMSIVLSTVPMMTLLLSLALGIERAGPTRLLGVGLGLAAMLMIALPGRALPDPAQLPWLILPVIVAASYAAENVYIDASRPGDLDPVQTMAGLSLGAALLSWPATLAAGAFVPLTAWGAAEAAILGASVLHVGAYSGFVWLIRHAGPIYAAQVGYVVTASGIGWGMAILGETHSAWIWAALVLLFAGLSLVRPRGSELELPSEGRKRSQRE